MSISRRQTTHLGKTQRGAALIIALIFVVVFTLLGMSVVGTTGVEEKMARNYRDADLAFAAAEAGLRDAEIRISGYYTNPATPVNLMEFDSLCTKGLCNQSATQPAYSSYDMTVDATSIRLGTLDGAAENQTPEVKGVSKQPRYLIEAIPTQFPGESASAPVPKTLYRISSLGYGRSDTTQVLLQEGFIP